MHNKSRKQIKNIADVILGYTFRSTLKGQTDGDVLVLQARNISEDIIIKEDDLLRVSLKNKRTSALAKNGDVVLSSRGNFKSAVIQTGSETVVASSSVYLLRIKTDEVLPGYLAIYLNFDIGQRQINERISGVVINALLRKDVEELEIIVPGLESQQKIINVYSNDLNYRRLLDQKKFLTSRINKGLINKLINN